MERHVPEPTHTLEGWHVLHDFRLLDFARWFSAPLEAREDAWEELKGLVREWRELEEAGQGSYGIYQVVGHKADLLFLNLRPGLDPLLEAEARLSRSAFARYLGRSYSFYSVVELGSQEKPLDPESPYVKPRLTPRVPKSGYVCFYPMNKRRQGQDNWYMLPAKERASLMKAHGETGRKYQGKVMQVISGAQGLDDWEWGWTFSARTPSSSRRSSTRCALTRSPPATGSSAPSSWASTWMRRPCGPSSGFRGGAPRPPAPGGRQTPPGRPAASAQASAAPSPPGGGGGPR